MGLGERYINWMGERAIDLLAGWLADGAMISENELTSSTVVLWKRADMDPSRKREEGRAEVSFAGSAHLGLLPWFCERMVEKMERVCVCVRACMHWRARGRVWAWQVRLRRVRTTEKVIHE